VTTSQWTGVNQMTNFTDASFRAFYQEIMTGFQNLGVTKTTDTGQVDFATVLKPTVANTYTGYEIRKFSDSITGKDIYLKFEFGCAASTANTSCRMTVGFATNGAGTITGQYLQGIIIQSTAGNVGSPVYSMCKTNGILWFTAVGQTGTDGAFILERRSNQSTGAPLDSYDLRLGTFTSANNLSYQCLNYNTAVTRTATLFQAANLLWAGQGSGLTGGDVVVGQTYSCFPEIERSDSHLYYRSGELTANSTTTATVFTSRTYMATNQRWHASAQLNAMFMGVWE